MGITTGERKEDSGGKKMSFQSFQQAIDNILEIVRVESKKSVEEYKAKSQEFRLEIAKIISGGFETPLTNIIAFIMQYSPKGLTGVTTYILNDISSIEKLILDTKELLAKKLRFPTVYHSDVIVLRKRERGLTTVFNKKILSLFGKCGVSARYNPSIWGALQELEGAWERDYGRESGFFEPTKPVEALPGAEDSFFEEEYDDFEEAPVEEEAVIVEEIAEDLMDEEYEDIIEEELIE